MTRQDKRIIATDLGHQYIAWALWDEKEESVDYGIWRFGEKSDCVSRCSGVADFVNNCCKNVNVLIVERQVFKNRRTMEIQFALVCAATMQGIEVILQHPLEKFRTLGYPCITEHKQHKKLSVIIALQWLRTVNDVSEICLTEYVKQDDCADSINELRTYLLKY
jgi:pheromone shutdown protein TraB